ncbi:MAG TPA: hypothetical protein VMT62_13195 [Syntrophorhabdaceae bacterium]|nr:hypothetical protein [Syntrophorhabdaceae bacterium]
MSESKYGKYIVTQLKLPQSAQQEAPDPEKYRERILYLDKEVVEGAFYVSSGWYLKASDIKQAEAHTHDFDEVVAFFGTNPEDPLDLCGEIEFWLGGEIHTIKNSCLIFVPKGLSHCPYWIRRVDRPIVHFSTAPYGTYIQNASEPQ